MFKLVFNISAIGMDEHGHSRTNMDGHGRTERRFLSGDVVLAEDAELVSL
jgi:hypothetical protein